MGTPYVLLLRICIYFTCWTLRSDLADIHNYPCCFLCFCWTILRLILTSEIKHSPTKHKFKVTTVVVSWLPFLGVFVLPCMPPLNSNLLWRQNWSISSYLQWKMWKVGRATFTSQPPAIHGHLIIFNLWAYLYIKLYYKQCLRNYLCK